MIVRALPSTRLSTRRTLSLAFWDVCRLRFRKPPLTHGSLLPRPGPSGGFRMPTLARLDIAPKVSFQAPPRTLNACQSQSLRFVISMSTRCAKLTIVLKLYKRYGHQIPVLGNLKV